MNFQSPIKHCKKVNAKNVDLFISLLIYIGFKCIPYEYKYTHLNTFVYKF